MGLAGGTSSPSPAIHGCFIGGAGTVCHPDPGAGVHERFQRRYQPTGRARDDDAAGDGTIVPERFVIGDHDDSVVRLHPCPQPLCGPDSVGVSNLAPCACGPECRVQTPPVDTTGCKDTIQSKGEFTPVLQKGVPRAAEADRSLNPRLPCCQDGSADERRGTLAGIAVRSEWLSDRELIPARLTHVQ
jgi:hypothetical protein